jgi:hydrogenase maturation protein HypF
MRLRVRGTVQGVGFRPFVYGLAARLGLAGFVLNDSDGVLIEVEGPPEDVSSFRGGLSIDSPPLAAIEEIDIEEIDPVGTSSIFAIRESRDAGGTYTPIPPDVATCPACLEEILDPAQRRYRYPFTNCTNCGPRFTITTRIPYDRPHTTMAAFPMCPACRREYENPADRRFHAQPIACPDCGPRLRLGHPLGSHLIEGDAVRDVADLLRRGQILALKGLGGYHLVCDATREDSVAELRERKRREEKPLAVMVGSPEEARGIVNAGAGDLAVLTSRRRPIVLLERLSDAPVAASVAPNNRYLGVMLPYTPLHHLLLHDVERPLVMTSGNVSDEPIAFVDDDAQRRLGPIADAFLSHNRAIHMRCDDSVVRVVGGHEYPIRRSRGYAPEPLLVAPPFARPILAAGPELKHTFCIGKGRRAILSHHIGDLETWEAMSAFLEAVEHFQRTFDISPEVIAHDLHPDYLSTKWARETGGVNTMGVQHHHAHIASCLADNCRSDKVIGLALDGTGYGEDGALWGCEVLTGDLLGYERQLHLEYVPLPGGAAAIRQPWRMAAAYLEAAFGAGSVPDLEVVRRNEAAWDPIVEMARAGVNSPPTSSAGRLFDAAAAICGVRDRVSYEGQAASELEQLADPASTRSYPCPLVDGEIGGVALIGALADDIHSGAFLGEAVAGFHNGLLGALLAACELVREREGLRIVALSGGTWQNIFLLERAQARLAEAGFEVLVHRRVPANDAGISLGQAMVANARVAAT